MLKKLSSIPFSGTPEQEEQLKAVIEKNKDDKSMLMHVMQEAQGIYGYLPYEVQVMIAVLVDQHHSPSVPAVSHHVIT